MNDMRSVIVPKSDQINADNLLGGPITITIRDVSIRPGTEQPVSVSFDGDDGKPYKPCKSMCKVMVSLWGPDANEYIGRSMTLYADPTVLWGGMKVSGIRISHMSHIGTAMTMALTATKGNKKPFTVKPLAIEKKAEPVAAEPPKRTAKQFLDELEGALAGAKDRREVDAIVEGDDVRRAVEVFPPAPKARLDAMIQAALARHMDHDEDGVFADATQDEAA